MFFHHLIRFVEIVCIRCVKSRSGYGTGVDLKIGRKTGFFVPFFGAENTANSKEEKRISMMFFSV